MGRPSPSVPKVTAVSLMCDALAMPTAELTDSSNRRLLADRRLLRFVRRTNSARTVSSARALDVIVGRVKHNAHEQNHFGRLILDQKQKRPIYGHVDDFSHCAQGRRGAGHRCRLGALLVNLDKSLMPD